MSGFNKFSEYKVNIEKSIVFLHNNGKWNLNKSIYNRITEYEAPKLHNKSRVRTFQ